MRTYESPRKSWNLILPIVVSASKFGNTSPSRSPGMVASKLKTEDVVDRLSVARGTLIADRQHMSTEPDVGGVNRLPPTNHRSGVRDYFVRILVLNYEGHYC